MAAEGIDLGELFKLLKVEGLSGEGTVSGVIPVVIEDGDIRVEKGALVSDGPGVLRYAGPKAPGALGVSQEQSELLFGALANFHYQEIDLSLNGALNETVVLGLRLAGANPDFLDGYPFKITLTTRADISQLIARGRLGK